MFDQSFHSFLITVCLQNIHTSPECLKQLELLDSKCLHRISKLHVLHNISKTFNHSEVFYRKPVVKKFIYDGATWKKWVTKKVQHKERAAQENSMAIVQHGKRATWKECNMKKCNLERAKHDKSTTWKKGNMTRIQHEESSHEKRQHEKRETQREWKKLKLKENMKRERNSNILKERNTKKVQNEKAVEQRKHKNWKK